MKSIIRPFALSILLLQFGCSDTGTDPGSTNHLYVYYLSAYIGADLMPSTDPNPDRISCSIDLRLENVDNSNSIRGISILGANVYNAQTNQKVGSITLASNWNGELGPGEITTVRFNKTKSEGGHFQAQCDEFVYLEILLTHPTNKNLYIITDEILFGCVY